MSKTDPSPVERWQDELDSLSKKLHAHAKAIQSAGDDAFALRDQIEKVDKTIREIALESLKATADVRKAVETACVEASAEFWQRFSAAAKDAGWEVHGSTERRLVARALFVEFKNDVVSIDAVAGKHSPNVASVIKALKPHVDSLATNKEGVGQFCEVLAQAYDALGGQGDVPIEAVFRQSILLLQPATFWVTIDPAKFQSMTRATFRCRLSAILADNVRSSDGREMRLTPTVTRKDVWELFSPAEGRVVQVGRLAFVRK
jgi:hypothetical protein